MSCLVSIAITAIVTALVMFPLGVLSVGWLASRDNADSQNPEV